MNTTANREDEMKELGNNQEAGAGAGLDVIRECPNLPAEAVAILQDPERDPVEKLWHLSAEALKRLTIARTIIPGPEDFPSSCSELERGFRSAAVQEAINEASEIVGAAFGFCMRNTPFCLKCSSRDMPHDTTAKAHENESAAAGDGYGPEVRAILERLCNETYESTFQGVEWDSAIDRAILDLKSCFKDGKQ